MSDLETWASALSPVHREPLSVVVAGRLREAILRGDLAQGSALPSEQQLGQQLGVGRSTVREALRILQAQGLVSGGDRVSTKGPVVGGRTVPVAAEALQTLLALGEVAVGDLVQLRVLLESAMVASAAERGDAEALARAAEALQGCRDAVDAESFLPCDVAFHCALADASGNRAFALVMEVLRRAMTSALRDGLGLKGLQGDLAPVIAELTAEHQAILDAVRAGDGAAAAELVREHLTAFYATVEEA